MKSLQIFYIIIIIFIIFNLKISYNIILCIYNIPLSSMCIYEVYEDQYERDDII